MIARNPDVPRTADKRLIPPGCCTWCGHPPHRGPCDKKRRIHDAAGKVAEETCDCKQREIRS